MGSQLVRASSQHLLEPGRIYLSFLTAPGELREYSSLTRERGIQRKQERSLKGKERKKKTQTKGCGSKSSMLY